MIEKDLLTLFKKGETLSTLTGNRKAHTVDFRKRVSDLRRKGHKILDTWVYNTKTRKRYKLYWLKGKKPTISKNEVAIG